METRAQFLLSLQGTLRVNITTVHAHDVESGGNRLRTERRGSRRRSRRESWISRYINNDGVLSVRIGDGHNIAVMSVGILEAEHGGTNSVLRRMEVAPGVT